MASQRDSLPAPLIVLCPPRSYSSVICAMIGQHPEMYAFPELNLFVADTVAELLHLELKLEGHKQLHLASYTAGLLRTIAELHYHDQTSHTVLQARNWLESRRHWTTCQLFDFLRQMVAPLRSIDKSPRTAMSPRGIQRAHEAYSNAHFIHVTRHPVATQQSMQRCSRMLPNSTTVTDHAAFAQYCTYLWNFVHRAILDFTAILPPNQKMQVRAEDLLLNPPTTLARIAAWLGVRTDCDAIQSMQHPERSCYACIGPTPPWAENDLQFLLNPRLRQIERIPALTPPPLWGRNDPLWEMTVELARTLGYS